MCVYVCVCVCVCVCVHASTHMRSNVCVCVCVCSVNTEIHILTLTDRHVLVQLQPQVLVTFSDGTCNSTLIKHMCKVTCLKTTTDVLLKKY